MPAMVLDLPPTLLQLLQLDRAGLIGVDQSPDLAVQHLELALDARALALVGAVDGGIAAALLEARPQEGRIGQQPADRTPDLLLERPGRGASAITGARGVAGVAGGAEPARAPGSLGHLPRQTRLPFCRTAIEVSLIDTSNPTYCSMAALPGGRGLDSSELMRR